MIPQTPFSRDILCSDRGSIVRVTGDCLRAVPSPPRRSSQASWGRSLFAITGRISAALRQIRCPVKNACDRGYFISILSRESECSWRQFQ